ncbi:MAG: HigA family addiction module antitoxin [Gemmatimonadota bacterium]|nr:HigA family addiction module antitoxin [Gemmatimonadota bacterium]
MPRIRTHPGQLLRAELDARNMSASQLPLAIRVPANRITAILRAERSITADTAVRLGRYLGTGAAFWMNLQRQFSTRT